MQFRFLVIILAAFAIGAAPATSQSTDSTSPKSSLKAYNLAMRNGDVASMLALQHAITDDEKHVARCSSQSDLQIAILEHAASDKFGDDGEKQLATAVDDLDDAAVDAAHETIAGDHASITFADDGAPIPMIRSGTGWAIDVGAMLKVYKGTPDELCDSVIRRGSVAKVTAQEINAGQFATASAAVAALKSRLKES